MFGVVTTFKFREPLTAAEIETIREQAVEPMSKEPGFQHYFVIQDEHGEVGAFHAWDSKAHAEAGLAKMAPRLQPLIADKVLEPPRRIMAEVIAQF